MRIKPQTKDTRNYPKFAVGGQVPKPDPDQPFTYDDPPAAVIQEPDKAYEFAPGDTEPDKDDAEDA